MGSLIVKYGQLLAARWVDNTIHWINHFQI